MRNPDACIVEPYLTRIEIDRLGGASDDMICRMVEDLAGDAAGLIFLEIEAKISGSAHTTSADFRQSLEAHAVLRSIDFGQAVAPRLADCTGRNQAQAEFDVSRVVYQRLEKLCRTASVGGRA